MVDVTKLDLPNQLLWLADAPSFIDGHYVEAFYDAVVRPYYKQGVTVSASDSDVSAELAAELGLGAEFDSGKLLEILSAWLPKMKATAEGKLSGTGSYTTSSSKSTEWHPITTPQRQLEQLVLHYHFYQRSRLSIDENPLSEAADKNWPSSEWASDVPRGLVLLDFPPGTKFVPTYGEYGDESVPGLIFTKLPGSDHEYAKKATLEEKNEYWKRFSDGFDVQTSVEAVENTQKGRLQVIDYRVPISDDGQTLHLHLHPRGDYPTITFAYNMIRRGFEHGLRLVGTMRSEPDLNVLAIYER